MPNDKHPVTHRYAAVMLSGTFTDLRSHRAALIDVIKSQALTDVAMENDSARADLDLVDSSLQMIREVSAYICIISHRYGQVPICPTRNPLELSLTELEFNEALRLGRPVLVFIMSDVHPVTRADIERNPVKIEKLTLFRDRATKAAPGQSYRGLAVFDSLEDFRIKAIRAIADLRHFLNERASAEAELFFEASGPIPAAPSFCAMPPYLGSTSFIGRQAQLDILSDWASPADQHPVFLCDGIGGSGKSILAWEWTNHHATKIRTDWAGRFWYSFYERGATLADFCRQALAYATGQPSSSLKKMKTEELRELLLRQFRTRPWLIILDGLERILVAYSHLDVPLAYSAGDLASQIPTLALQPEDDDLLRVFASASPSKLLITSRLVPHVFTSSSAHAIPGVLRVPLTGLRPSDAEALIRSCGISGTSEIIQNFLIRSCDCHPLVTAVLASLIINYLPARGNFDAWASDPNEGARLNLADLDLISRRNHILKTALEALPENSRQLLYTLAGENRALHYSELNSVYERLVSSSEKIGDLNNRSRQPTLADAVQDLDSRGLLHYDSRTAQYDLHPLVRSCALGLLAPDKKSEVPRALSFNSSEFQADQLTAAIVSGDVVLFAGAGVGAQAGLPVWRTYVGHLFEIARANALFDDDFVNTMGEALDRRQSNDVADSIALRAWPNPSHREIILNDLKTTFNSFDRDPSRLHLALAQIPFRSVLTTNFDSLLGRVFAERGPILLPQQIDKIKELIAKRSFFGLHLYGIPDNEESLLLTSLQFSEFLDRNIAFGEALASLYAASPFLFVGCSFEGIQGYLTAVRFSPSSVQHYALIDISNETLWKAKSEVLRLRYGINVIPYDLAKNGWLLHPPVESLLEAVRDRQRQPKQSANDERPLKQVTLRNIGALQELELEFRSQWTVLIGPNGVGKSTVLRAIAMAFAGEAAGGANGLLRTSAGDGRIEIQTSQQSIVINIRNTGRNDPSSQFKIERSLDRPLEFEPYPILAFPPLRAFGPTGTALPPEPRPVPEDVLPMALNLVDHRLSELKSWLINLDHKVREARHARIRDYFFYALGRLTLGISISPFSVDPDRSLVLVQTPDGEVPIEAVSQGSASLMCWVGVLLQRLADVHYKSSDPWNKPALVLIDEIDTHMHPLWQRIVVQGLKDLFPRVQFIATTHSALTVADLSPDSIVVFRRDPDRIICTHLDQENDIRGLRTDQILLSDAFGLQSVRGPEMERDQDRYVELSLKLDREFEEEAELADLSSRLSLYKVAPEETRAAREAARLIEEFIDKRISGLDKDLLIKEIRAQMLEIKSSFRRHPVRAK